MFLHWLRPTCLSRELVEPVLGPRALIIKLLPVLLARGSHRHGLCVATGPFSFLETTYAQAAARALAGGHGARVGLDVLPAVRFTRAFRKNIYTKNIYAE